MFFFIFSTVYFNPHILHAKQSMPINDMLAIPGTALIVFTVFFIHYAHNIFIKRRKSEFGLFMTLGMSNKDIGKLLLLENIIIALLSMTTGLVAGVIFSRLIFLLLMNLAGIKGVSFHLSSGMFLYTIFIFLAVFFVAVGRSFYFVLTRNIIENLNSDEMKESIQIQSSIIGGLGLLMMIVSFLGLSYTIKNVQAGEGYLIFWASLTFIGLYIILYQGSSFFLSIARKKKDYFYPRILYLTNLDYKFKQLTAILMLVTVMIFTTILYSTINLFNYLSIEKEAIETNPYDIAFLQTENKNHIEKKELYSIIHQKGNPMKKHLVIPIYSYYENEPFGNTVFHFMSLESFNQLTSKNIQLKDKEYLYFINESQEYLGDDESPRTVDFSFLGDQLTFKDFIAGRYLNLISDLRSFIILDNQQLERVIDRLDVYESKIHLINVANWKKSGDMVEQLSEKVAVFNESASSANEIGTGKNSENSTFEIASKIEHYERNKNSEGIIFYIATMMSVIFFFGSFILLYLNVFLETDREKEKFKKLHRIGMTFKEGKKIIFKELRTLFFLPAAIGTIVALLYIIAMSEDVGGVSRNPEILFHFFIITIIYHVIDVGFYLYARKKMLFHLWSYQFDRSTV